MITWIFIAILAVLALIDYFSFKIPNLIILPAIGYGIYLTGNWLAALIMFALAAVVFKHSFWRGGDVKLMCLIGAFMGLPAILILPMTLCLIYAFRITFRFNKVLPVTPFSFVAALPFIATIGIRC